ncbi:MAG: EpsG family protein [Bacteroidaceae bacterium]|nr:EpsG family protein [Bacteroidaceae bacterium]
MLLIDPTLYVVYVEWFILGLTCFVFLNYHSSTDNTNLLTVHSDFPAYFLFVILALFLGLRPSSYVFGDTGNYGLDYKLLEPNTPYELQFRGEWLFNNLKIFCKRMGWSVHYLFLIIEIVYIGLQFWTCKKLLWENSWIAMLFCVTAFSFYTYGTNGIRNGMGASLVLFGMALILANKNYILGGLMFFLATGVHNSTYLPALCFVASITFVRNPKWAIYLWIASILVSFSLGNVVIEMFRGLGFDDRLDAYLFTKDKQYTAFGVFRWDFLLYSSVPVIFTWYVVMKRNIQDKVFNALACTYILANSSWVMVIRASYSNRFAYLSWFLYPIVLAYGLIRLHIWDNQDRKVAIGLLLHFGFTFFMFLMGKI